MEDNVEVYYKCKHGSNGDYPTELSHKDVNQIIQLMFNLYLDKPGPSSDGDEYGCKPMYTFWDGIVPKEMSKLISSVEYFIPVSRYPESSQGKLYHREIGAIGNIRFIEEERSDESLYETSDKGKAIYNIVVTQYNDNAFIQGKVTVQATER